MRDVVATFNPEHGSVAFLTAPADVVWGRGLPPPPTVGLLQLVETLFSVIFLRIFSQFSLNIVTLILKPVFSL